MKSPIIEHPKLAFGVIILVSLILNVYGMRDGAITIFALLASVLIYKLIANSLH